MLDERKKIEELIYEFHSLKPTYKHVEDILEKDFEFVDCDGEVISLNKFIQLIINDNKKVKTRKSVVEYISRIEISDDGNSAFAVMYVRTKGTVQKFFGPVDYEGLCIYSSHLRKNNNKWKFTFMHQTVPVK